MWRAVEEREHTRQKYIEVAGRYVDALAELLAPLTGILYGSVARGDFNFWSDIDVAIIADRLPEHPLRRAEVLFGNVPPGVEPKGFTRREFLRLVEKGHPFARELLQHGIVLRDDLHLWCRAPG
ncbi:MAG: uncharacterized protein PWP12_984, partial [Bacillota bacterium]|nr:uncharacterized protein [Bacillota bacterium]